MSTHQRLNLACVLSLNSKQKKAIAIHPKLIITIRYDPTTFSKATDPHITNISKNSQVISLNICCRSYLYTLKEGKAHSRQIWD